jgi:hypothetical protein
VAEDHFSGHARAYAAHRPAWPEALVAWSAGLAPTRRRAADVATGSGIAARALAEHFDDVLATDISGALIDAAEPHPRVRYAVQAAEELGAVEADLVVVAQALHWLDAPRFGAALQRALVPGGAAVAWGYAFFTVDPDVDALLRLAVFDVLEPYWPARVRSLWGGWTDVALPGAPIEAPPFALDSRHTLDELWAYLATWSAWQRAVAAGVDMDAGREIVEEVWGDGGARSVHTPLFVRAWRL